MTPTSEELRKLADLCDQCEPGDDHPAKVLAIVGACSVALRACADREDALRGLMEKWNRQTAGSFSDRANCMARCADELEALLGNA